MMEISILPLGALFGLIIGSFLSVCIYRLPLGHPEWLEEFEDESEDLVPSRTIDPSEPKISISSPRRSFCPHCKVPLKWWHNIPLVSWLLLGGSCGFCKAKISVRYPFVELLSSGCAVLALAKFGWSPTAMVVYVFCASLIVISFIDYDLFIIPNVISLPGTIIGLFIGMLNNYTHIFAAPIVADGDAALLGVFFGGGFLWAISEGYLWLRKKEGLGMGDVKLLFMTGALFGIEGAIYTIFVGSLLGSVIGVLLIILKGRKFSQQMPFGPYLAVATFLFIFWGNELIPSLVSNF